MPGGRRNGSTTPVGDETNRPGPGDQACDRGGGGFQVSVSVEGERHGFLTGDPLPEGLQAPKQPKLRQQEDEADRATDC